MEGMNPSSAPGSRKMGSGTMKLYYVLLAISVVTLVLGIMYLNIWDMIVSSLILLIQIATILYDRKTIHIPPAMMVIIVCSLVLSLLSKAFESSAPVLEIINNILIGVTLSMFGFICAYMALGKIPEFSNEKPLLMAIEAFTFGVAMSSIIAVFSELIFDVYGIAGHKEIFRDLAITFIGCLIMPVLYLIDRKSMNHTIFNFVKENSETLGICQESDRLNVESAISEGESDTVEYKSTLVTNLQTGEKDKRMEKAVLKTIVAFLNSNGGRLLIGVDDSGTIIGIDDYNFDNRDKLNLHMTNLISSRIGDEFIPYIRFRLVPFEEKAVMLVECKKCEIPVFLKDNKTEIYFVRSGPSTVELTGSDMLKYIKSKQSIRKIRDPAYKPQEFENEG
ncbi:MAG: ATP-binding protein [Candidatus Methanomethylophilaceae archaeon]|nr:ATP-binding protein [Candidatus Methanomethylophilaceae archaeon]